MDFTKPQSRMKTAPMGQHLRHSVGAQKYVSQGDTYRLFLPAAGQMCLMLGHSVSARFFPFNRPDGRPKMKDPVVCRRRVRPCRDASMLWGTMRGCHPAELPLAAMEPTAVNLHRSSLQNPRLPRIAGAPRPAGSPHTPDCQRVLMPMGAQTLACPAGFRAAARPAAVARLPVVTAIAIRSPPPLSIGILRVFIRQDATVFRNFANGERIAMAETTRLGTARTGAATGGAKGARPVQNLPLNTKPPVS